MKTVWEVEHLEETKKVYNILGDYPNVVAPFLTRKVSKKTKSNVRFN